MVSLFQHKKTPKSKLIPTQKGTQMSAFGGNCVLSGLTARGRRLFAEPACSGSLAMSD